MRKDQKDTKHCKHNAGWWTHDAVVIVHNDGTVGIFNTPWTGRTRRKVVLHCNIVDCGYRRHAYFDATGALVTLTPPYRPQAGLVG